MVPGLADQWLSLSVDDTSLVTAPSIADTSHGATSTTSSMWSDEDEPSIFLPGECLVCHAVGETQLRCVNRDVSCHGLPPCCGVWCPGCYATEGWIFHTIKDDGLPQCMRPLDARRPGWRCHVCELSCMLGRAIEPEDRDWEVTQLAMQYKLDSAHHVAVSTGGGYETAWGILQDDIARWHGETLVYDQDQPRYPPMKPERQFALEVGMSIELATSALYDKGHGPDGQCTFNHARTRRSAFAYMTQRHGPIHDSVQKNQEFLDFIKGIPKRVGTMSTPAHPLHVETLLALVGLGGRDISRALREDKPIEAVLAAANRLVLVYAFFLMTRGNEPFRLRKHHWRAGMWFGQRATQHGLPEHMRIAFNFPTKTLQTSYKDGVLGMVSASGVRIGAMTEQYDSMLRQHASVMPGDWKRADGRLFPDSRGQLWSCGAYLASYLRPQLLRLQAGGHTHLRDIDIRSRMDFWSIRRGANTWADTEAPGIPSISEAFKEEHVGWARVGAKRSRMSRHYSQKPASERIKVTTVYT